MPSAVTLLIVALCTNAKDVVSSATSRSGNSNSNRSTKGRTQLVSVSAPWPTSPLSSLAEASEFVAEGGGRLFWDYVEAIGDAPHSVFCPPPYTCSSYGDSAGDGAATAEEGGSRHDNPQEPAVTGADASHPQEEVEMEAVAARLAAEAAAVTAAGHGFGSGAAAAPAAAHAAAAAAAAAGGGGTPGVGLDALSLRLLEVALSARSHAAAVESHRVLAAPTRSACSQGASAPPSPSAWVVLLPSGDVVCSPEDLDLSPSPSSSSETCSAAAAGVGTDTGAAEAQDCRARGPPTPASGAAGDGPAGSGISPGGTLAFDHVYASRIDGGDGGSSSGSGTGNGNGSGGDAGPMTTAILYGVVGSPTMMRFHRVLKAAAEAGTVTYAFRHALPYGGEGMETEATAMTAITTPLQGYGVVLDVKNMEYQSFDSSDSEDEGGDKRGEDDASSAADDVLSIVEGEEVGGVVFSTVAARRPELKRELGILRQALLLEEQAAAGDDGSEELKVWNMGDLGLQALQSVAAAENPLLRLEELSQNFPSHASALSALKVQSGTREEAQSAAYYLSKALGLRPGSLYVNGKMVDLEGPTFNVFQILSMLRAEAAKVGELGRIRAPKGALSGDRGRSLLAASGPLANPDGDSGSGGGGGRGPSPPGGGGGWRVDIVGPKKKSSSKDQEKQKVLPSSASSSPSTSSSSSSSSSSSTSEAIAWLNDIEVDQAYKTWPPSLQQLLYGMGFQMPRVRKNLCNLVIVMDPTTPSGAEAMQLLGMVIEQGLPVRVGLLLVSEADLDAVEGEDGGGGDGDGKGQRQREVETADGDGDGDDSRPPQAKEIAELVSRLAEHAGSQAVTKFVGQVGAAAAGGCDDFTRRRIADMFRKASSSTKGLLHESPESAEPWTKKGSLWGGAGGGEGGAARPLPRARAMARLCLSKGLPVQSWSVNGRDMGGIADIRAALMQVVMQEHMLIGQLYQQGLVSDKTRDVYSRVLKHSGDKIHPRIHPAFAEPLADARVSDLSSPEAAELMFGTRGGGDGEAASPALGGLDWLHPSGTSDHAKGVSVVAVVDPMSRKGLGTLEQALSLLLSENGEQAGADDGDTDNADGTGDGDGGDGGDGDAALPGAGVRLAVVFNVFNPSAEPAEGEGGGGAGAAAEVESAGRWLPAVFEAVGGRAPDKAPRFLLSLTKAAMSRSVSPGPDGAANASQVVETVAREAGLSPSLRATVVEAAAAAAAATATDKVENAAAGDNIDTFPVGTRKASLVRSVTGIGEGESCAFVNGRKALPAREGRPLTAADLSIAIGAAGELGEFLRELALGWDWGSWPEGSPESSDPDMVGAQLQSDVILQLASFLWRYHQEHRQSIPDPDELSQILLEAVDAAAERAAHFGTATAAATSADRGEHTGVISVLHLGPDGRLRRTTNPDGVSDDDDDGAHLEEGDGEDGELGAAASSAVEDVKEEEEEEGASELGDVAVELVAVLDPLSMAAQRASTLLSLAQDVLGLPVTLLLLPALDVSELPLKSFYRLVLGPASGSVASFEGLPARDTLTQRLDTPEPWNVQASSALQDLDNLRCDDSGCGNNGTYTTSAEYTLKGLLLTGRCYDVTSGAPSAPQGLQLVLRSPSSLRPSLPAQENPAAAAAAAAAVVVADTVVMENLGYFQLQAGPGLWELALAKGRASEVYEIIGDTGGVGGGGGVSGAAHAAAHEVGKRLQRELGGEGRAAGEVSPATEAQAVAVRNFYSRYEPVLVRKRPGMEDVFLLEPDEESDGMNNSKPKPGGGGGEDDGTGPPAPLAETLWSSVNAAAESVRSLVGLSASEDQDGEGGGQGLPSSEEDERGAEGEDGVAGSEKGAAEDGRGLEPWDGGGRGGEEEEGERLHVFSLATGHLYERFLKVMMMSVVKRASLPVTFWLLENFLSSSFKESAQALAQEYGFRVELVTYKWPEWLRRQSEKQRIIWGYKILFLDVLFPLNVDKVIYVDADQVVRADLKELWDLDLEGAPYAYTPFCSSREETLGYQFWRGGFWQTHLMGRPYHISALYVVDLKTFRRMAVGDTLRSIYNSLSQDPNSLSNLDQDLPNYAQVKVPMFSLPQEWLWCESWCSDASKAEAKTIDLCNNPQHKEPKLDMAKRVISGPLFEESWVELDAEVRAAEDARSPSGRLGVRFREEEKEERGDTRGTPSSKLRGSYRKGQTMPGARDQDVLSFLAEWFDPLPQLTKQYLLKYFCDTNEAEMVELKTKRLFLKRSPCPPHFTTKDFALGSKIILYGRDLTIAAFADKPTEEILTPQTESAVVLVGPEALSATGKILDDIVASTGGLVSKLKMARVEAPTALEAARCVGLEGGEARDVAAGLCRTGAVVLCVVRGHDARSLAAKACTRLASRFDGVWCCGSEQQGADLEKLFAPGGPVSRGKGGGATATFDSCTCCVIKPHAVKAGNVGKIIDKIFGEGFEVSALETFRLSRTQAEEFFEVYQGVIPKYGDMLDEMTTGTCVALEIRGQNVVSAFREAAGPWDVDMAKELRPNSIRGMFGEGGDSSNDFGGARTGVHCTDLAEDGPSESRYFFELMQGV
eukprot:g12785.t1